MPLIQLVTDLKSLKYGKDTPGGGYSGQPYIQAKIPDGLEPKSADFILRGGYLTVGDSLTDIKRLTKMFFDLKSPNGLFFIAKQNVLSNSAVRTQTSGVLNEGIYTPLSTLAEAGVIAFGGHLNKQGINPFRASGAYADNEYLYYNKISQYNSDWLNSGGATALDNRLFALYESRILNNSIGGYDKPNNINVDLKNTLLTYRGGPGSILGVGQTDIRFEDNGNKRTGVNNVQLINSGFFGSRKALPIPGSPFSINVIETPKNPAAGNFSVFKRPNSRTTSLFIAPYGVSDAYEAATNQLLPQGPNGSGSISLNGGYTFDPSFYYNVYKSGSLTPYDPVINSQKILQSIDINNKQVGGLQIEPFRPWTWGGPTIYTPNGSIDFKNFLPRFDLNKPQSGSLDPKLLATFTSESKVRKSVDSSNGVQAAGQAVKVLKPWTKQNVYNTPSGEIVSLFLPDTNVNTPQSSSSAISKTGIIEDQNVYVYSGALTKTERVNPSSGNHLSPKIQDFRKVLRDRLGETSEQGKKATALGATPIAPNYQTENIETRVHLGNPGKRADKNYSDYTTGIAYQGAVKALDQINALPIYRSDSVQKDSEAYPVNDLVKFRIAAIDGTAPNFQTFIHFRAFIDSFSDSYTAEWTGNKYMGRGEDFYTYNGFGRTISLSFTVAAQSKQELIPMYQKLNYLASNLAPDYSPSGYMRGPLVQLTMGGYLYEQVGFITALTYDVPNDTTWEIGINTEGGSDSDVKELPHRINVSSFNFTPIHNFVPQKQGLTFTGGKGKVTGFGRQRYIALSNGSNTNWSPQNPTF
jgi:hypothetical protein